jgi:hypothetical protein
MKYFLAHNGTDVFNHGEISDDQVIETGLPFLEFFYDSHTLSERLSGFNVVNIDTHNEIDGLIDGLINDVDGDVSP